MGTADSGDAVPERGQRQSVDETLGHEHPLSHAAGHEQRTVSRGEIFLLRQNVLGLTFKLAPDDAVYAPAVPERDRGLRAVVGDAEQELLPQPLVEAAALPPLNHAGMPRESRVMLLGSR